MAGMNIDEEALRSAQGESVAARDARNDSLANIIIVLDHPQDPTNIGAVIRAMKNMGVHRLRLVQPVAFEPGDLLRIAHRCEDLLAQMETHASLDSALADAIFIVGTDAQTHRDYAMTSDIRTLAAELVRRAQVGPVVILLGSEANGLDRNGLDRCHVIARMPTAPTYPALNLAQAAILVLYELRMAVFGADSRRETVAPPASHAALERVFTLTREVLGEIGFFKYNPEAVMHSLRRIVYRAELSEQETALLLAILRQLHQKE